ncbi:MAG: Ig-like domain-containing protein [Acidobacteria bacterium]|nr:Ig-like domain-containing protein [Acidobacteriota bacterium]
MRSYFRLSYLIVLLACACAGSARAAVTITVTPSAFTLTHGQTLQITATVTGTTAPITWTKSGIGALQASGNVALYTAPASVFQVTPITIKATVQGVSDTCVITLQPTIDISISPTSVTLNSTQSQQFRATVTGTANTAVNWSITPSNVGSISADGLYTPPANITSRQTVTVKVVSVADPTQAATATVTLISNIAVTVEPSSVNLTDGQTQQFTATVFGTTTSDVTWSLSPAVGTISATGLYTAPSPVPAKITVTVKATSVADPGVSDTAIITLSPPSVNITIAPASVSLTNSQTQQFVATVTGHPNTSVTWSINPSVGTIAPDGLYTAPSTISVAQKVTVTATSVADPTKSASATVNLSQLIEIGGGAPSSSITQMFRDAFNRGTFSSLVALPPLAQVARWGSGGFIQLFQDAAKTGLRFALVSNFASPVPTGSSGVFQVLSDIYTYYNSLGVNTVGYPTMDTATCQASDGNPCTYQIFSNSYALFVYKSPLLGGTSFYVRSNLYLKWIALGGISGLGAPVDGEVSVTSPLGGTATRQVYQNGVGFTMTSGAMNGKTYAVGPAINTIYTAQGGYLGSLGFPVSDEIAFADGHSQQTFQGGTVVYVPGSEPQILMPVKTIILNGVQGLTTISMNYGDSLQLTVTTIASNGLEVTGRTVTWVTSNNKVVSIQANGPAATLRAVGGGTADITALCEGQSSPTITIHVAAVCCQVGEGAPNAAVQQAFQDAVTRNHLSVALPAPTAVKQTGGGYTQYLQSADAGSTTRYLLAKSNQSATAYVVSGNLLAAYEQMGGPGGSLGYPTSDATTGGRQLFENGALAGDPVKAVSGVILTKWAQLGYETGVAGPPTGDPSNFLTFMATAGVSQSFRDGVIYGATNVARTGQIYFVSGLILNRYQAIGSAAGVLGMPLSDEFASDSTRRQNFEGGYVDYVPGDTAAQEHVADRSPAVNALPNPVIAGSRVNLSVSGFAPGSKVRVSVSGQPDFEVTAPTGAYVWEVYVPTSAGSGTVTVHAADTSGSDAADGSYTIKSVTEARASIVKLQGDGQSGYPGALLPQPLRVAVRDGAGNPVTGVPVMFEASPGAQIVSATSTTDQNGEAQALVRLPFAESVALFSVKSPDAAGTTFGAIATASSFTNFPKLMQTGDAPVGNGTATIAQKGALLAASASILRYYQSRGELPSPNGLADPNTLNTFLKNLCAADSVGNQVCDGFLSNGGDQVVNLWRLGEFVGGAADISVEKTDQVSIRDLIAQGAPVLIALSLTADGVPAGGHFVVGIGVAADGGIFIHDPNPAFARASLSDYLAGFSAASHAWQATLTGAFRLVPGTAAPTRFLVAAVSQTPALLQNFTMRVDSVAGSCGKAVDLADAAVAGGAIAPSAPPVSRFLACDGKQSIYQLSVGAAQPYRVTVTDFSSGGSARDLSGSSPAIYKVTRPAVYLVVASQDLTLSANAVVNAANFTSAIAPGGVIAIFGSGFTDGTSTFIDFDGTSARLLNATPFRLDAQIPESVTPGTHLMQVRSPWGTATQTVNMSETAPAIYSIYVPPQPAVINPDGKVNSPTTPVARGEVVTIYATGLGTTTESADNSVVTHPVVATVNGVDLPVIFAGLASNYPGVYVVNVRIPVSTPPGLNLALAISQGSTVSNMVSLSVR